jgi:hypothetical protein
MAVDLQDKFACCKEAFEAYAAMRRIACQEPHLLENEYFKAAQDTTYARFIALWDAV